MSSRFPKFDGVFCDVCNREISGVRYKCLMCADFDYCWECVNSICQQHSSHHPLLEMVQPVPFGSAQFLELRKCIAELYTSSCRVAFHSEKSAAVRETGSSMSCDVCKRTPSGPRFKCLNCPLHSECEQCHDTSLMSSPSPHVFARFRASFFFPGQSYYQIPFYFVDFERELIESFPLCIRPISRADVARVVSIERECFGPQSFDPQMFYGEAALCDSEREAAEWEATEQTGAASVPRKTVRFQEVERRAAGEKDDVVELNEDTADEDDQLAGAAAASVPRCSLRRDAAVLLSNTWRFRARMLVATTYAPHAPPHRGVPGGYIAFSHFGFVCHIISLAVAESARRLGLGEKLIRTALQWACDQGCVNVRPGQTLLSAGFNDLAFI